MYTYFMVQMKITLISKVIIIEAFFFQKSENKIDYPPQDTIQKHRQSVVKGNIYYILVYNIKKLE